MFKLKLKIEDKGFVIDIPGIPSTRTPALIDITKANLNNVITTLRKNGINNYKIYSINEEDVTKPTETIITKSKEIYNDQKDINKRFNRLEKMIEKLLLMKSESKITINEEQITNKLEKLEELTRSIAASRKEGVADDKEPVIEVMENMFVPEVDVDGMSIKGSTGKVLGEKDEDIDEAIDLLSSMNKRKK